LEGNGRNYYRGLVGHYSETASLNSKIEKVRLDRDLGRYSPKIVYVLSGGAATGFCHLGMIESLEKRGIRPDLVIGTSAGALFGALYSHFGNVEDVFGQVELILASDDFKEFERKYFGERKPADGHVQSGIRHFLVGLAGTLKKGMHLGKALATSAMVAEKDAVSIFGRIFEGITFQTLKVPFAAVAVDLVEGAPVIFAAGPEANGSGAVRTIPGPDGLMNAVMASSAIPLIFPAVEIGGHAHADGYIMSNLPVREAQTLLAGQEMFLVGFDVSAPVELSEDDLSTVELVLRLLDLSTRSKQSADRELVDVLFQPVDRSYPWSSFAEYKKFIGLGRRFMTEERLAAFDRMYLEKCVANVRKDKNASRRYFSNAKLKRFMAQQ
jgi:NTE family protein